MPTDPIIRNLQDAIDFVRRFHRDFPLPPELKADELPGNIPSPLTLVYRELGGWLADVDTPSPLTAQNYLYRPQELTWADGFVEFAAENQQNWYCRCLAEADDPPVISDSTEYWSTEAEGFNEVSPRLSEFLTTFLLTEALFACKTIESHETIDVRPLDLTPLWLNGRHAYEFTFDFYTTSDESILFMRSGEWYLGAAGADE